MCVRSLVLGSLGLAFVGANAQTWQQLPDFPGTARDDAASFVLHGKIYVGTGFEVGFNLTNDWWRFDPSTDTWTAVAAMPTTPRQYCTAFTIADTGFVFGGIDAFGAMSELWAYYPDQNVWEQRASLPAEARYACVAVEGYYSQGIVATGMLASGVPTNEAWKYHTDTDSWEQITSVPGPSRHRASCFLDGGGMRIVGGADSVFTALDDSWSYPIWFETGLWYPQPPLPSPRYGADGSGNGVPVLVAGSSGVDFHSEAWLLSGDAWTPLTPFPGGLRRGGVGAGGTTSPFWNVDFYYGLGLDSALQRQNDWWRLTQTVGIAENSVDELPMYPNPASDRLHIPSLHSSDRVQFVDALGRVHELLRIDTNAFDVSHLGAGLYTVIASGRTGGLRTARFIKE